MNTNTKYSLSPLSIQEVALLLFKKNYFFGNRESLMKAMEHADENLKFKFCVLVPQVSKPTSS